MRLGYAVRLVVCMLVWGLGTMVLAATPPADFYVATSGSDRWSGTLAAPDPGGTDGPFASLERARNAVRGLRKSRPIRVLIRGGVYVLDKTLRFGPEDSGTAKAPVIYEAFPAERPVISGGMRIAGPWRKTDHPNVLAITLPKGVWVQDLFVAGKRQVRARMPNSGHWKAKAVGKSKTTFGYEPGQLAAWPDAASGVVVIRPYEWVDYLLPIKSIDTEARRVVLAKRCNDPLVPGGYGGGGEYHVENVRAALDRPGEWCHNRQTGVLELWPAAGVDLAKSEVIAGNLPVMISLEGRDKASKWVEHIVFRGLTFQHSGRQRRWRYRYGAAVLLCHGVRKCRIEDSRFVDLGASGVVLWKECQDNAVTGCEFVRTGDTPIYVKDYRGEGPPMGEGNQIVNNYIHHCGTVRRGITAIEVTGSQANRIAHNHIHDLPYVGIRLSGSRVKYWSSRAAPSLKRPYTAAKIKPYVRSRNNVVEFNHIHHVMQELYDGAGIYFWGTMGDGANIIRNNLIHHVGTGKRIAAGIYLDDSCDDVVIRDNVVYGANMGLYLHGAPGNLVENNIFAYSGKADISIGPEGYNVRPMNTTVRRNIFMMGRGQVFNTGEGWNKHWPKQPIGEMDYNLYWRGGKPVALGQGHLKGKDEHSVVADPAFAEEQAGRFVLRPGAAAAKLGIKPIDLSKVGLLKPLAWRPDLPKLKPLRLPLPAEVLETLPGWQPHRSTARAYWAGDPPKIDGKIADGEWPGWISATSLRIEELADKSGPARRPGWAYLLADDKFLYVAMRNDVADVSKLRREGGRWGADDGAEVCLQPVGPAGKAGPVFVLHGYPSGKLESSTEAGAPAQRAKALGKSTRYAADVGRAGWTAEFAIPWEALRAGLGEIDHLRFNIGAYNKADRQWIAWIGTGKENWRVADAGVLRWRPRVLATAKNLVRNGDLETGESAPVGWSPLWWSTSREPKLVDRDPKCEWVPEGIAGSRCLKIHSADTDRMQTRQGGFSQSIPSPGSGRYLLSYDLRAAKLAAASAAKGGAFLACVHVVHKDGKHGANLGADASRVRQGTFGWLRQEVLVDVPANAKTLTIIFEFQRATGTVWIDNVAFRPFP